MEETIVKTVLAQMQGRNEYSRFFLIKELEYKDDKLEKAENLIVEQALENARKLTNKYAKVIYRVKTCQSLEPPYKTIYRVMEKVFADAQDRVLQSKSFKVKKDLSLMYNTEDKLFVIDYRNYRWYMINNFELALVLAAEEFDDVSDENLDKSLDEYLSE